MQKLMWLENVGSLEEALKDANELYWNMSVEERDNQWIIWAGEKALLVTDSRESVDAFLYGLGLAYSILPEKAFEVVKEEIKKLIGEEVIKDMEYDKEHGRG